MIHYVFFAASVRQSHLADARRGHTRDVHRGPRPDGAEARPVGTTPRLRRPWGKRRGDLDRRPRLTTRPLERQLTTLAGAVSRAGPVRRLLRLGARRHAAIVYAADDGALWRQPVPGGPAEPLTAADPDRPAAAPAVAPGRLVRRLRRRSGRGVAAAVGRVAGPPARRRRARLLRRPRRRPDEHDRDVPGVERARHAVGRRRRR